MSNQKLAAALNEHLLDVLAHVVLNYLQFQLRWAKDGLWRRNPYALLKDDGKTAALLQRPQCLTAFCADLSIGMVPAAIFSYSIYCGPITDQGNFPYVGLSISPACAATVYQADISTAACIGTYLEVDPDQVIRAINGALLGFLRDVPAAQETSVEFPTIQTSFWITVDKSVQTIEISIYSHKGPTKQKLTEKPFLWTISKAQFDQLTPFVTLYSKGDTAKIQLETPDILDIL